MCVWVTRSLQLFPYTSRINFKHLLSYLISLYKGLLLFVYTHNENKTDFIYLLAYLRYARPNNAEELKATIRATWLS